MNNWIVIDTDDPNAVPSSAMPQVAAEMLAKLMSKVTGRKYKAIEAPKPEQPAQEEPTK